MICKDCSLGLAELGSVKAAGGVGFSSARAAGHQPSRARQGPDQSGWLDSGSARPGSLPDPFCFQLVLVRNHLSCC